MSISYHLSCSCITATPQRFSASSHGLRSITPARSPFIIPRRSCNVTRARKVGSDGSSTDAMRYGVGDVRERAALSLEGIFKSSAEALQVQPLLEELSKREDLGKRGELWFAAQIGLLAVLFFPPAPLEGLVRVAGIGAVVAGLALAAAGQQSLGNSLSPFPAPRRADDHALVTDGVYQYTRHPMYGGLLLLAFGLSAASGSDLRFAFSFALYYVLNKKVKLEEKALEERYSSAYEQYRSKAEVKKFIPWLL